MRLDDRTRLAYRYGLSLLHWATDSTPAPFSATFAVTDRCNLFCSYCNCPALDPTDLPLADIAVLFDRLRAMGVCRLGITGGEPLVRKDLGEILALAKARRFFVCVNTNLTLYGRFPGRLADADLVFTSLDGDPAAHRANRGDDAYEGVIDAIRDLVRARTPVVAICVVTEENLGEAERLLAKADELGIRIHFQPQCSGGELARGGYSGRVTDEEFRAFWRRLVELKARGLPLASSRRYLEYLARWEDFGRVSFRDPAARCAAGRGFVYVDPRGNAHACPYTRGKLPPVNLLRDTWQRGWSRETPCTQCRIGPMLEFNLLFQHPVATALDLWRPYGSP